MGKATAREFEPLRAEPNGFLVHHLNHSVTLSLSSKDWGRAASAACASHLRRLFLLMRTHGPSVDVLVTIPQTSAMGLEPEGHTLSNSGELIMSADLQTYACTPSSSRYQRLRCGMPGIVTKNARSTEEGWYK